MLVIDKWRDEGEKYLVTEWENAQIKVKRAGRARVKHWKEKE